MENDNIMNDYRIQIIVDIYNFEFSPSIITDVIGVVPDRACLKGARNKERRLPRSNIWSYRTSVETHFRTAHDHWDHFIEVFGKAASELARLLDGANCDVTLVVSPITYLPVFSIPPDAISILHKIRANFYFSVLLDFNKESNCWISIERE